jgi:hypothetical protein
MKLASLTALLLTACAAPYTVEPGEPYATAPGYYERCVPIALVKQVTETVEDAFVYTDDPEGAWTNLNIDAHTGEAYGDCEDYAYTVQSRIREIGYARHTARMAILDDGEHAALVVESCEAGQVIVDNQNRGAVVGVDYYDPQRWYAIENEGGFGRAVRVR